MSFSDKLLKVQKQFNKGKISANQAVNVLMCAAQEDQLFLLTKSKALQLLGYVFTENDNLVLENGYNGDMGAWLDSGHRIPECMDLMMSRPAVVWEVKDTRPIVSKPKMLEPTKDEEVI
jgi:hypothetical protein